MIFARPTDRMGFRNLLIWHEDACKVGKGTQAQYPHTCYAQPNLGVIEAFRRPFTPNYGHTETQSVSPSTMIQVAVDDSRFIGAQFPRRQH